MHRKLNWGFLGLFAIVATAAGCSKDAAKLPTASISSESESAQSHGESGQKPATDRLHPIVVFHIARGDAILGDIRVKLDAENAPLTVDNFLYYIEQGQYDNTLFHQVTAKPIAIILGGGYDTFGKEKSCHRPPIRNEAHNGLKNHRGTIAMARRPDSIDSSTAQFFINLSDNADLDYKKPVDFKKPTAAGYGYCVFGEVVAGMEIADQIGQSPVHNTAKLASTPVEPVVIKSVQVVR